MPYIEKKGKAKYAYGWSKVGEDGKIVIPPEALKEYKLKNHDKALMMARHKLSGGFELIFTGILKDILGADEKFAGLPPSEGEARDIMGK
jgi:hypothetical protein